MVRVLCLVLLMLESIAIHAATVKGSVTDTKGERLPYATIFLQGTTIGTTTNGNGDYELTVPSGKHKLMCQYIGFKPESYALTITDGQSVTHNFVLSDEGLEMKEVVVKASNEDPAYKIIRNAIKRRKQHLDRIKTFQTSIYFKGVVRSRAMPNKFMGQEMKPLDLGLDTAGKGVIYLAEQDATYYTDGKREKTVIHSVHESGDKGGLGFSRFPDVISFYENNVPLLGRTSRGFISPISDNALSYYTYKLIGEFTEHDNIIYKIRMTPKRKYEPCFSGDIYIASKDYSIHSLSLSLVKESGLDMIDTLKVNQIYLPSGEDWVIKSQVISFALKFMLFDVTGSGVAVYNKQRINEEISDSIFAGKITSAYDKGANKKDTSYWEERPVPLETDEVRDFVRKDSIGLIVNSPAYQDSLRKVRNKFKPLSLLLLDKTFASKEYKNTYTFNSVIGGLASEGMLNYNTVEGIAISPRLSVKHMIDTGRNLYIDGAVRYGTSNTHFNGIARVYYTTTDRTWLNRGWAYGGEAGKYVFQYNNQNPVAGWLNTYRTLLMHINDMKVYERIQASAFVRRNYGNGFTWMVRGEWQRRLPLQNTSDFSFVNQPSDKFTDNAPIYLIAKSTEWQQHDAALIHAEISFKPGYTYTQYPDYKVANGSKWPRFTLSYDKGIPDILNSKVDFDKWRFSIKDNFKVGLLGAVNYNIAMGGFITDKYVSIPDLMHINGREGTYYAAPYLQSFQLAPYYNWSNRDNMYSEAHIEYHLNGFLSNKIPLLRQARYYLVAGANSIVFSKTNYYTEAFIGVENIGWKLVRFLRVDYVQSWDAYGNTFNGIRFGINLNNVSLGPEHPGGSQW